jgi:hypothetical protein
LDKCIVINETLDEFLSSKLSISVIKAISSKNNLRDSLGSNQLYFEATFSSSIILSILDSYSSSSYSFFKYSLYQIFLIINFIKSNTQFSVANFLNSLN